MRHIKHVNRLIGWGIVAVLALFVGALFEGCSKPKPTNDVRDFKLKDEPSNLCFSGSSSCTTTGITGALIPSPAPAPAGFFTGNFTLQCSAGGWVSFVKDGIVCKYSVKPTPKPKKKPVFRSMPRLPRDKWEPVTPGKNYSFDGALYYRNKTECDIALDYIRRLQPKEHTEDVCQYVEWHMMNHVAN